MYVPGCPFLAWLPSYRGVLPGSTSASVLTTLQHVATRRIAETVQELHQAARLSLGRSKWHKRGSERRV